MIEAQNNEHFGLEEQEVFVGKDILELESEGNRVRIIDRLIHC